MKWSSASASFPGGLFLSFAVILTTTLCLRLSGGIAVHVRDAILVARQEASTLPAAACMECRRKPVMRQELLDLGDRAWENHWCLGNPGCDGRSAPRTAQPVSGRVPESASRVSIDPNPLSCRSR